MNELSGPAETDHTVRPSVLTLQVRRPRFREICLEVTQARFAPEKVVCGVQGLRPRATAPAVTPVTRALCYGRLQAK